MEHLADVILLPFVEQIESTCVGAVLRDQEDLMVLPVDKVSLSANTLSDNDCKSEGKIEGINENSNNYLVEQC